MRELLRELLARLTRGESVCYTALVETRGSTPQKAGAAMLVFPDGSQQGTLGGGCVEAEVKREALARLHEGQGLLRTFLLDRDYGWDDGLICGGRMQMLIDPIAPDDPELAYFHRVHDELICGRGCTEVVLLNEALGAGAPSTVTVPRWLVDDAGEVLTTRGVGEAMTWSRAAIRPLRNRPRPYVVGNHAFLPHLPRCRLVIVGAGHVGQKVAQLASEVDFDVCVIDDRPDLCSPERFPLAVERITGTLDQVLPNLPVDESTYAIIVTRGHNHDEEALFHLATKPARYLGLIGSRRKIRLILNDLLDKGLPAEVLRQVYAPIGFEIGSQTVPEIAVSIVAELIAHRNLGHIPERPRDPSLLESPQASGSNQGD